MTSDVVQKLGLELWAWRALQQPHSGDDIPRLPRSGEPQRVAVVNTDSLQPRPEGFRPEFSAAAVERYRIDRDGFAQRWVKIDTDSLSVPDTVDHRLLGSLLARVTWELDVLRSWERDALFWVDQALGSYMDLLLDPSEFSEERASGVIRALENVPGLFEEGRSALEGTAAAPFAQSVIEQLSAGVDIRGWTVSRHWRTDRDVSRRIGESSSRIVSCIVGAGCRGGWSRCRAVPCLVRSQCRIDEGGDISRPRFVRVVLAKRSLDG